MTQKFFKVKNIAEKNKFLLVTSGEAKKVISAIFGLRAKAILGFFCTTFVAPLDLALGCMFTRLAVGFLHFYNRNPC